MKVTSEQQYTEIPVTDIDIAFPGDLQTFTLRDGVDTFDVIDDILFMNMAGGELSFRLNLAHWWAIKRRTIRVPVPVPAAPPEQSAVGAPPANTSSTPR